MKIKYFKESIKAGAEPIPAAPISEEIATVSYRLKRNPVTAAWRVEKVTYNPETLDLIVTPATEWNTAAHTFAQLSNIFRLEILHG